MGAEETGETVENVVERAEIDSVLAYIGALALGAHSMAGRVLIALLVGRRWGRGHLALLSIRIAKWFPVFEKTRIPVQWAL